MSGSNGSVTLYDEMAKCGREHVVVDPGSMIGHYIFFDSLLQN
jgi:hypothetical protein